METFQKKIINLFIEQELLLADLYERFSVSFPEYKEFWLKMSGEEREHAEWVNHLLNRVIADEVFFAEGNTRSYTVSKQIEYIKSIIDGFEKKPRDIVRALAVSRDLEASLIERNMFKFFDGDSSEVKRVLSILEEAQYLHCSNIKDRLTEAKNTSNKMTSVKR